MNRTNRLLRQIPGAPTGLLAELAAKPAAEVELIVEALKQARLDERQSLKMKRTERRKQRKKANRAEDEKVADAADLLLCSIASRAARNIDLLPRLKRHRDGATMLVADAVAELRRVYPDTAIAEALGIDRSAVGHFYGPRDAPSPRGRWAGTDSLRRDFYVTIIHESDLEDG